MKNGTAVAARWKTASRSSSFICSPTARVVTRCVPTNCGLWVSSAAYVLMAALRQYGLKNTPLQQARCDTIRLKLLKIGAVVRVTVRRVWFALAESCPYQGLFAQVFANLRNWQSQLGPAARRSQLRACLKGPPRALRSAAAPPAAWEMFCASRQKTAYREQKPTTRVLRKGSALLHPTPPPFPGEKIRPPLRVVR